MYISNLWSSTILGHPRLFAFLLSILFCEAISRSCTTQILSHWSGFRLSPLFAIATATKEPSLSSLASHVWRLPSMITSFYLPTFLGSGFLPLLGCHRPSLWSEAKSDRCLKDWIFSNQNPSFNCGLWSFDESMQDPAAMVAAIEARFSSLELIGRGSFGDVFKGWLFNSK